MIDLADLQYAFLLTLALPLQWLAVFYLLVTLYLAVFTLAWAGARKFMTL